MEMSLVLQLTGHKIKYQTNEKFDLIIVLKEKLGITKVSTIHPAGT